MNSKLHSQPHFFLNLGHAGGTDSAAAAPACTHWHWPARPTPERVSRADSRQPGARNQLRTLPARRAPLGTAAPDTSDTAPPVDQATSITATVLSSPPPPRRRHPNTKPTDAAVSSAYLRHRQPLTATPEGSLYPDAIQGSPSAFTAPARLAHRRDFVRRPTSCPNPPSISYPSPSARHRSATRDESRDGPAARKERRSKGVHAQGHTSRSRRQDVRHGDPWSQCPQSDNQADSVETKVLYGVEGNSTFLECVAKAPLGGLRWTVRSTDPQSNNPQTTRPAEGDRQLPSDDSRSHTIKRGLLVQRLELADGGFYTCTAHEHSYSQVLARYQLHVIPQRSLLSPGGRLYHHTLNPLPVALGPVAPRGGPHPHPRGSWLAQGLAPQAASPRGYKDLLLAGSNSLSQDEYCEQLWYREKRRQQKLRALKLKQESRKARVRRNYAPGGPL
ncbi:unnamed protein product [Gadus morhua 'NCC']